MWYKVKRIMMRPNGVEKQVRPSGWGGWTFTYDFVNKTTTQLTNDGRTNASWLTTWANWVTANSWTAIFNQASWLSTAMANANKITIVMDTYNARWGTDLSGVGVCDSSNVWPTQIWFYVQSNAYVVDCGSNVLTTYFTWPAGDSTITCEWDFVNKTCYLDFPNVYTGTMSLTDSQIATKSVVNSVRCPLQRYRYIKSLSITII